MKLVSRQKFKICRALPHDFLSLAERLRVADRDEIRSITGVDAASFLGNLSVECDDLEPLAAVDAHGNCHALWGEHPHPLANNVGIVWFLSSEDAINRQFVRHAPRWIEKKLQQYEAVTNIISIHNTVHIRWLRKMGFSYTTGPLPNTYQFYKRREDV